jgi:hypothetical protein
VISKYLHELGHYKMTSDDAKFAKVQLIEWERDIIWDTGNESKQEEKNYSILGIVF